MEKLADKECVLCTKESEKVSSQQESEYMQLLDGWTINKANNVKKLDKTFAFQNFVDALAFTNAIGKLAELENHHPMLVTEWGRVRVIWWTHSLRGLFDNDFILAARTDRIYEQSV